MKNRILSLLLALVLLHSIALTVAAASPMPDLSSNGSITFTMKYGNKQLDGGTQNLCKVATLEKGAKNEYVFVLIPELKESNADMNKVTDPAVAKSLLKLVDKKSLSKISTPIANGQAVFSDLPVGLYLVWQDEDDASDGFSAIQPFLISVPKLQDGAYVLDVVAKPKVPLETEPTEPTEPPPPPPPNLPQTGQLNWPVPVMAMMGCAMFVLGLFLYSGRKGTDDEA